MYGKPYTKAQLIRIKNLFKAGLSVVRIANLMNRPPGGIALILRECRRMEMMEFGKDTDTLVSWNKGEKK